MLNIICAQLINNLNNKQSNREKWKENGKKVKNPPPTPPTPKKVKIALRNKELKICI